MALSWMERIQHFFKKPEYTLREITLEDVAAAKPEPTEFEKIYAKFNLKSDMIVLSKTMAASLKDDEKQWLDSLGNRVYYFTENTLVNIAIVKSY